MFTTVEFATETGTRCYVYHSSAQLPIVYKRFLHDKAISKNDKGHMRQRRLLQTVQYTIIISVSMPSRVWRIRSSPGRGCPCGWGSRARACPCCRAPPCRRPCLARTPTRACAACCIRCAAARPLSSVARRSTWRLIDGVRWCSLTWCDAATVAAFKPNRIRIVFISLICRYIQVHYKSNMNTGKIHTTGNDYLQPMVA